MEWTRGHLMAIGLTLGLIVASSTVAGAADWTQFGAGRGHTRAQPREQLIGPDTVLTLERAWSVDLRVAGLDNEVTAGPSVADGRVFAAQWGAWDSDAGTARSQVVALGLATGDVLWTVDVPGVVSWSPAVLGDTVVVALRAPGAPMTLIGLRAADGVERWSTAVDCPGCPAGQVDVQPPVAADGVVVATLGDHQGAGGRNLYGFVRAYDAATGVEIWGREVPAPGMPVIADGVVVVSHESRRVNRADTIWALELDSGDLRWRRSAGVGGYVYLSAADRTVFATTGAHLLALSTRDGASRWERRIQPILDWATVGPRTIFQVHRDQPRTELIALDRVTGAELWTLPARRLQAEGFRSTWLTNDIVFLPTIVSAGGDRVAGEATPRPGTIAVRPATGRIIGRVPLPAGVGSEYVAVADGFLVIVRDPARLVAFSVPTPPLEGAVQVARLPVRRNPV